ncbi:MAG: diguanylate cyclase with sensor [Herbinix sp.]|jgi:diguanylate cyclase (GGDEF)-like protein|nr:diguanylate cyclase with sensor [Herbinix sp.]
MNSEQFERYQEFTEKTINQLSWQVTNLEKKLDMFTNLLEISRYINQYIKDPNLFSLINDMLIGVFGAMHSSIYIKSEEEYDAVTQNVSEDISEVEKSLIHLNHNEEFILNSESSIFCDTQEAYEAHSCMGVPVKIDNRLIGYIIIQHKEINYFTKDHAVFLSLIGNHIGVAIENNFLYKQIKESAYRDGLTEIFNKRYFFETLNHIANLTELNYSIVIVDLDDFKLINDHYGHPMGDAVLKTVAQIISNATRTNDIVARYGGDEIIMYMQNFIDKEKVRQRVEYIRSEIERTVITDEINSITVTASFGVYIKNNESLTLDEVIKKADEVMYLSKDAGKNKVSVE